MLRYFWFSKAFKGHDPVRGPYFDPPLPITGDLSGVERNVYKNKKVEQAKELFGESQLYSFAERRPFIKKLATCFTLNQGLLGLSNTFLAVPFCMQVFIEISEGDSTVSRKSLPRKLCQYL
jgi:hypothetical protein